MQTKKWIGSVVLLGIITLVPLWGVAGVLADTESPEETASTEGATSEEAEEVGNQQEAETDAEDSAPEASTTADDRGGHPDAGENSADDSSNDSTDPESVVVDDLDDSEGSEEGDLAGAGIDDHDGEDDRND
jgi:hypothetical protein